MKLAGHIWGSLLAFSERVWGIPPPSPPPCQLALIEFSGTQADYIYRPFIGLPCLGLIQETAMQTGSNMFVRSHFCL